MTRRGPAAVALALASLLAACGADNPPPPVAARDYTDPGFVTAGGYELRYGAVQATELPPAVSEAHGIARRDGVLVVNLSVLRRRPGQLPEAVEASVAGSWRDLVGTPRPLEFRRVMEGGAVSYVAEAQVGRHELVVLQLQATPPGAAAPLQARITRRLGDG